MEAEVGKKKTIIKNTLFLYLRQIITLIVSFYSARVVLDVVGVDDYGIYTVVAGVVILVALVNNSMVEATQRFLTYELGKSDMARVAQTFCMCMTIHIAICLLVLLIGETIGLYYVVDYLVVPSGRENAAVWCYHISLLSVIFTIIRAPYTASIIAYEKMSFYAYISIIDVVLKLLVLFLIQLLDFDKLILYSVLILGTDLTITLLHKMYCQRMFTTCTYSLYMDVSYFKRLTSYLGWSLVGVSSTMGTQHIGNMIINRFVGVAFNAAYGTANRISSAVNVFLTNFQVAFRPQIIKLYAQNELDKMHSLMFQSALISFYLLFVLSAPVLVNIDYILGLWLVDVPPSTGDFCLWVFMCSFLDSLQAPFWMGIAATGKNRNYQLWQSSLYFLNIPITYYLLANGYQAYTIVLVRFIIGFIGSIIRTVHVNISINVPIWKYVKEVLFFAFSVSLVSVPSMCFFRDRLCVDSLCRLFIFYVISVFFIIILIYTIGINKQYRQIINAYCISQYHKYKKK